MWKILPEKKHLLKTAFKKRDGSRGEVLQMKRLKNNTATGLSHREDSICLG